MTINRLCWAFALYILIAFVWSQNAKAETNVFVGAWSKHLISKDLNEEHRLFAVEHNNWFAGTFTNSYDRESYAVAHKFKWTYGELEGGVYVGAVRGYTRCWGDDDSNTDTCPLAVPYIAYDAPVAPQIMLIGEAVAVSIRIGL
jgi:hypothetical protein